MNAFDLYFYSLIPTGIAIIVALCVIAGLLCCYCKKGRQNEDPVPKVTGDVERGAQPNYGSCSGSQESNQPESGETANMLYFSPPELVIPKITSPSKNYLRGASQTEQLLKNTDDRSPDSSNDSPYCVFAYSQSQEKITTNSPLLDYSMCRLSPLPTVIKISDDFTFIEKQNLENLRNSEIIVTNSIESRNDLNLEERLTKVRQDTKDINNLGSQEIQIGESNERSNLSDFNFPLFEAAVDWALEQSDMYPDSFLKSTTS